MKKLLLGLFALGAIYSNAYAYETFSYDCYPADTEFGIDFLWWKASGQALDYGSLEAGTRTAVAPIAQVTTGFLFETDPQWKPGIRLTASQLLPDSDMRMFIDWTWYKTHSHEANAFTNTGTNAFAFFLSDFIQSVGPLGATVFTAGAVESRFYFQMNQLNFGIAKAYSFAERGVFTPFVAGSYFQANEDIFVAGAFVNGTTGFARAAESATYTKYKAGGGKIGFSLSWDLFSSFKIFGLAGLTGTYGKFREKDFFASAFSGAGLPVTATSSAADIRDWQARFFSQVQVGMSYNLTLMERYMVIGQLAWEHQTLIDQTDFILMPIRQSISTNNHTGNLYVQGLVARLAVGF